MIPVQKLTQLSVRMLSAAVALCSFCATPALSLQASPYYYETGTRDPGTQCGLPGTAATSDMVSGDFDRDGRIDLARICGGKPLIYAGVGTYNVVGLLDVQDNTDAVALAVYSGSLGDQLVTAGPDGIDIWSYDASTGYFTPDSLYSGDTLDVTVAAMNGGDWVVGLPAGGLSLRFIQVVSGSAGTSMSLPTGVNPGLEIEALQWVEYQDDHIAIRTASGIEIRDEYGLLVDSLTPSVGGMVMAPMRAEGDDFERLACINVVEIGTFKISMVKVIGESGVSSSFTGIGMNLVTGATAADISGDGLPELLVSYQDDLDVYVATGLADPGGNSVLSTASLVVLANESAGEVGTGQPVAPVVADFNNDGALDVAADRPGYGGFTWHHSVPRSTDFLNLADNVNIIDGVGDNVTVVIREASGAFNVSSDDTVEVMFFERAPNGEFAPTALIFYQSVYGSGSQQWSVDTVDSGLEEQLYIVSRIVSSSGEYGPDSVRSWTPGTQASYALDGEGEEPWDAEEQLAMTTFGKDEGTDQRPDVDLGDEPRPPGSGGATPADPVVTNP